jgi:hypothetical protein
MIEKINTNYSDHFVGSDITEERVYIKKDNNKKNDWRFTIETKMFYSFKVDLHIPDMGGHVDSCPKNSDQYEWMKKTFPHKRNDWFHWKFNDKNDYDEIISLFSNEFELKSISVFSENKLGHDKLLNYHPLEFKKQRYSIELKKTGTVNYFLDNNNLIIEFKSGGFARSKLLQRFVNENRFVKKTFRNNVFKTSPDNYNNFIKWILENYIDEIQYIYTKIE